MTFRLQPEQPIENGLKRIVRRQLKRALHELDDLGDHCDDNAHNVRKRCKKVRAVLRLLRDGLGKRVFRKENARLRDVARFLAAFRDAKVLTQALDTLLNGDQTPSKSFGSVRKFLEKNKQSVMSPVLKDRAAAADLRHTLKMARSRPRRWQLPGDSWIVVHRGLVGVYNAGYRAHTAAAADRAVRKLHEWRKQAKCLYYQLQVLECYWPEGANDLHHRLEKLSELLGDDHDLALLGNLVMEMSTNLASQHELEELSRLIIGRRCELQNEALRLGPEIYRYETEAILDHLHEDGCVDVGTSRQSAKHRLSPEAFAETR